MKVIGITGGIGSGKSVVSRVLRLRAYHVYDCDYQARLLMNASTTFKEALSAQLGEHCIDESGCLRRPEIAKIIFSNSQAREWINAEVHSMVRADIIKWIKTHEKSPQPLFIESAILFSSRLDEIVDTAWLVVAPLETRLQRLRLRDNTPDSEIVARIIAQEKEYSIPTNIPVLTIVNDGIAPLLPQINSLINNTKQ